MGKWRYKIISISTLIVLLSIVVFSYRQYDDYQQSNEKYNKILQGKNEELDIFMTSLIVSNREKAELYINQIANNIHSQIKDTYGNELEGLEYDIKNPTEYSKLTKILERNLSSVYINKDTKNNKPFVMSMENILWNRTLGYEKKTQDSKIINIDEFIKGHYNKELSKIALDNLRDVNLNNKDMIFWEVFPNTLGNEHALITEMNLDTLLEIYRAEGINGLQNYDLLIPVYITKDGDIFGTKDVSSLGFKVKNYKIIIVQRVNVYDIINDNLKDIRYFENEISKVESYIDEINHIKVSNMIQSSIFIVFILIGSACLQNKIHKIDE